MQDDLMELLHALERPLRFASRNGFQNLSKVRDLEDLVSDLTVKAKALPLTGREQGIFETLKDSFAGYDSLSRGDKMGVIERALGAIGEFRESRGGDVEPEPSAAGRIKRDRPSRPQRRVSKELKSKVAVPNISPSKSVPQDPFRIPIQYVKGVGPKIAALFAQKGVETVGDALFYFPRRYEDRRAIKPMSSLEIGKTETVMGEVVLAGGVRRGRRGLYQVVLSDGTGRVTLVWFQYNEPYLKKTYKKGTRLILSGEVSFDRYSNSLQIIHPRPENIEVITGTEDNALESIHFRRIVPVYPLTGNLGQRRMRRIMSSVVDDFAVSYPDPIPQGVVERRGLIPLPEAISRAHFPAEEDGVIDLGGKSAVYHSPQHKTLAFYDFFLLELGLALKKKGVSQAPGIAFSPTGELTGRLASNLPFELTPAQQRVLREIEGDMRAPSPMSRLLQGDVGCGKTIVAVLSMLKAVECGCQCALMAPTEILADQHFSSIKGFLEGLGVSALVLKSALGRGEKKEVYRAIESGEAQIVIGTHALIQGGVKFHNLGLVIIDEQHRFGVWQRARLVGKGVTPDVLVMTATPIPRTLAMTVYGDLDVSVIDEMPPGRSAVKTSVLYEERGGREEAYEVIRREVEKGRQVYVVYPLIEESENLDFKDLKHATKMAEELRRDVFPDLRVGLIHGRLKPAEKEGVMRGFINRDIDILVATTVIEVGVDVPNATVMVIENAERYGLSQLHQLRGRIGRGEHESNCVLLTRYKSTDVSRRRLKVLQKTTDGFRIAEADLMIRGPGDFMGTKQSGLPEFRFANILRDQRILGEAREEAFRLVRDDPRLDAHPELLAEVVDRWGEELVLASV